MTARVYVHSVDRDFADTDRLSPAEYLGHPVDEESMAQDRPWCCDAPALVRVHRSRWMRLVPFLRLYSCTHCGARVLSRHTAGRTTPYGPVSMPAEPLRPEVQRLLSLLAQMPAGRSAAPPR